MEHQIHFGKKFYKDCKNGYWISTECPKIRAHRWVWINNFGKIPKGFHIHHIDENKSNNDIANLRIISASDHISLHLTDERRKKAGERCNKIRYLTKEWHASEQGKAWHKYHALKCNFGKNQLRDLVCHICNKSYQSSKSTNAKFCSNNCKSEWRRRSGLDDIPRKCEGCLQNFICNKYKKKKFCTTGCRSLNQGLRNVYGGDDTLGFNKGFGGYS